MAKHSSASVRVPPAHSTHQTRGKKREAPITNGEKTENGSSSSSKKSSGIKKQKSMNSFLNNTIPSGLAAAASTAAAAASPPSPKAPRAAESKHSQRAPSAIPPSPSSLSAARSESAVPSPTRASARGAVRREGIAAAAPPASPSAARKRTAASSGAAPSPSAAALSPSAPPPAAAAPRTGPGIMPPGFLDLQPCAAPGCAGKAKKGCERGRCLRCCCKEGGMGPQNSCLAHREARQRKAADDRLLSGEHESQAVQQEKARRKLPKGTFHEDTFQHVGDTCTIWCQRDFVGNKAYSQETMDAQLRSQRVRSGKVSEAVGYLSAAPSARVRDKGWQATHQKLFERMAVGGGGTGNL